MNDFSTYLRRSGGIVFNFLGGLADPWLSLATLG